MKKTALLLAMIILAVFALASCEVLEGLLPNSTPTCEHKDENADHKCDACQEVLTECQDSDNNHKCDVCDAALTECADKNGDHNCDLCTKALTECADGNNDHKCDLCGDGLTACADADGDHVCDICTKALTECVDSDENHECDICGNTLSVCADTDDHKCDICGKILSECADTDDHKCDVCGTVISSCTDTDMDYKCDVCPILFEDVSYALNISDLETGKRADDDINGKFTIVKDTEVRTRTRTYEGTEYTKSVKLGSSSAAIKVSVSGDGKLSFLLHNGSSSATTQFVVVVAPDGTKTEYEFPGTNEGSPVVKIDLDVTEGEWTIQRKSGTIDVFYLELSCHLPASPECGFELVSAGKTDFLAGELLDLSDLRLNAIYESGKTDPLSTDLVTVDTSKVKMTESGEYDVTVSYKDYAPITYKVSVYVPSAMRFGFDTTEQLSSNSAGNSVYFNHSFKELYRIGEEFDKSGLSVTVIATCGEKALEFTVDDYTVEGFDSETKGEKTLTVSYGAVSGEIVVHVTDMLPVANEETGKISVIVDPAYLSYIGDMSGYYYIVNTIQQALDFLEAADATAEKEICIAPGIYKEKLEITIPNLTVIGVGEKPGDVIIEWNSLYGLPDAGGFSQVTDSTATVAIRDTAVNCVIDNLTISNYWNSIEVFNKDLGAGYPEHRALALLVQADRFILKNSVLLGYQDTVEFFTGRQYVENCLIKGTTDFIFGTNNTTLFKGCTIHSITNGKTDGGYITAFKGLNKNGDTDSIVYGAIFYQCVFTADEDVLANGNTAIGRTWGAYASVALIECEIGSHVSTKAASGAAKNERYVSMNGILPTDSTVQFVEFGNTGAGSLTEAVAGMKMLTAEEAALYSDLAVIFGKTNGKLTYLEAWDPFAEDIPADDKTYYHFDDTASATGTSYTLPTDTSLAVGESVMLGDMLICAEGGKIAWNANSGMLNMKAGAFLKFSVPAGTEILITAYPGYQHYTVNGVATSSATFSCYFAEATEVVILSIGDCYLGSVIVNPNEEAPQAPTLTELKVEGLNVNYLVGEEISLDGVSLKAYYSDGSIHSVDYECNTNALNNTAAGVYDIVFTYGDMSVTVQVSYEDPNADPAITDSTVLDFTTTAGLEAVQNNKRVTMEGSIRHNGGEIQIKGTISFLVKAGTVITVEPYANTQYASYTFDVGDGDETVYDGMMSFAVSKDGLVTYTGLDNNYLCRIYIECPVKEGKYVFGGASDEGDVTGILESACNINISGTFNTHSGGAQMGESSQIIFTLSPFASFTVKGFDSNYGQLSVNVDGVELEMEGNGFYSFVNSSGYTVTVNICAKNIGTEEAPDWSHSYITYLDVNIPKAFNENTAINFGSEGNYKDSGIDFAGANIRDNGGNNSQFSAGSISFVVREGATVIINGYSGYTSYTISDGDYWTSEEITDTKYEYSAWGDVVLTITPVNSNNYFYSIIITYPVEVKAEDFTVTFGSEGNYKDSAIDFSGIQIGDNGGNNSQVKNGSFSFEVLAGATVTINGYPGYTSYTLSDGTTTTEEITAETYTYTAEADVTITITPVSGNNYFYSFSVDY